MEGGEPDTPLPTGGEAPATEAAGAATRSRRGKPKAPAVTQAEPTAPVPVDPETGLELDQFGLPTSGPARTRWLADRGIDDPALNERADETEISHG